MNPETSELAYLKYQSHDHWWMLASSPGPLSKIRAWYTLSAHASSRAPIKGGCGANRDTRTWQGSVVYVVQQWTAEVQCIFIQHKSFKEWLGCNSLSHTLAKYALSLWRRLQKISLHSESLFSTPMRHSSLVLHSPWREQGGMQRCHLKLLNKSPARSWQGGNILHVSEFSYLATSIHNWIEL